MAHQAKIFFTQLCLEGDFDTSSDWLMGFKERHGIRELYIQGEKLNADEEAVKYFKKQFQDLYCRKICYQSRYTMPMKLCYSGSVFQKKPLLSQKKQCVGP